MAPRSAAAPSLGQTWILNDDDDTGEISWAEDSEQSDIEQTSVRISTLPSSKTSGRAQNARKSPRQAIVSGSQTQLIMPAVDDLSTSLDDTARSPPRQRRTDVLKSRQGDMLHKLGSSRSRASRSSGNPDGQISIMTQIVTQALGILLLALSKMKQPVAYLIAGWLFLGLLVVSSNLLTSSVSNAVTPICRLPGISLLRLPVCRYSSASLEQATISSSSSVSATGPEFDALMTIQSKFETVMTDAATGASLPIDMKKSESSIRDLRQVVRFSSIPSKKELLHEFDGFIETARITSYDLQKFNSHVGRAVDNVLATARWTQRVLSDIQADRSNRGLLPGWLNDHVLAPFQPLQFTEARLLDQYIVHSRIVSDEIEVLITEATGLLHILTNLEDRLDIIHGISTRDNMAAKASRDEILSQLWTYLGGNRAELRETSSQLALLTRLGQYRKLAYNHLTTTIVRLQSMSADLEELRSRVGTAEVLRDRGVGSIPLAVHLEAIQMGVARLEEQRKNAKEVEKGHIRRAIDAGDKTDHAKLVDI